MHFRVFPIDKGRESVKNNAWSFCWENECNARNVTWREKCNERFLVILPRRVWLISAALLVLEGEQILLVNYL